MASAYAERLLMPPLLGLLARAAGVWLLPFYLLVKLRVMLFMSECSNGIGKHGEKKRDNAPKTEIRQFAGCKSGKIIVQ